MTGIWLVRGFVFTLSVADGELPFKDQVYAVTKRGDIMGRMVKTKSWRYIEWNRGENGAELYDQENDSMENNNLAQSEDYASVVNQMKILLARK